MSLLNPTRRKLGSCEFFDNFYRQHARNLLLIFLLPLFALAGCVGGPSPTRVELSIKAENTVNPDPTGRPSPIQLFIFQLTSVSSFQDADFFQLSEKAQSSLGSSLVGKDELIVSPGASRQWNVNISSEAKYLGVIAAYRDLDNAVWRATVSVIPRETTRIEGVLGAKVLSLKTVKSKRLFF